MINSQTYKVKPTDTLASIAKSLNLDEDELKGYHNDKSHLDNRILFSIPEHVTEIVVPPKGFVLKNGKETWADDDQDQPTLFKLSYNGRFSNTNYKGDLCYGIFKTIQSGTNTNTIKYNIDIRFYPRNKAGKFYVSIDLVSKTYINNEEPDLVADELALACTKTLYPIVFQVTKEGLLLEIQNHNDILSRWEKQKVKNLKYYKGEVAEKYFQLFEQTLMDKNVLFHFLQNDWFYQLYFNTIYTTYNGNYELERSLDFPILPNTKSVQFHIRQEVDAYLKNKHIKVELKGKCCDPRSKIDLEKGQYFPSENENISPVDGNYRALYFLHPKTKKIQSAFLECNLKLKKEKSISLSISEIEDTIDKNKRHPDSIIEPKEKKNSFLKKLFS